MARSCAPEVAGDEPVLLARELPGVGVVVCADRYRAGSEALKRLDPAPDLFLLDDGFSHVRLARDIDLLAFPAADPFGGGRLAPAGRLREPLTATALADAALLTDAPGDSGDDLARALAPSGFQGPGFASETVALPARLESGQPLEPPAPVIALSAIARPGPFHHMARAAGFEIRAELALGDHHAYPETTLRSIQRLWNEHSAAALLTTSKDLVKLARASRPALGRASRSRHARRPPSGPGWKRASPD